MSKEVSALKVGGFVLAILFLAIGMILFFGTTTLFTRTDSYILYFEDSVKGLSLGSSVKFKGVPIGQVKKIYINYNQPENSSRIPVLIEVDAQLLRQMSEDDKPLPTTGDIIDTQVERGLRAQLQMESFITGLLFIELNYFPSADEPTYVQVDHLHKEIPTIKGPFSELDSSANDLLARIAAVDYEGLTEEIKSLAANMNSVIESVEVQKLGRSIDRGMESLANILYQADERDLGKRMGEAASSLASLSAQLEATMAGESATGVKLDAALENISEAAAAIGRLADYLERNPNALLTGKSDE